MSGARTAVRTTRAPDDLNTSAKRAPSFVSWSQTSTSGAVNGGVPGLLRAPSGGRPIRDRGMDDPSAAEVEEEEHEDFAEPDVVRLDEVARPRDVVAQERRPALAIAWGPGAADVPLDGPLCRRGRRA